MDIDSVYENFVKQIAGDRIQATNSSETVKDTIEREEEKDVIKKQISALQAKIRKEKQINIQMKMNKELNELKKKLEAL